MRRNELATNHDSFLEEKVMLNATAGPAGTDSPASAAKEPASQTAAKPDDNPSPIAPTAEAASKTPSDRPTSDATTTRQNTRPTAEPATQTNADRTANNATPAAEPATQTEANNRLAPQNGPDNYSVTDNPGQDSTFDVNRGDKFTSVRSNNPFSYTNSGNGETGDASKRDDGNYFRRFGGPVTEINAGDGNDNVNATSTAAATNSDPLTVNLGAGDDESTTSGFDGNLIVNGQAGNDKISSEGGGVFNGQEGEDDIQVGDQNNTISAGEGNDKVRAGNGDNIIYGQGGDDKIVSGDGSSLIYGGKGNDDITAGEGNNTVAADLSLVPDENGSLVLRVDGSGDDNINLGDGDNIVGAGRGADVVNAGDGNNTVFGDEGADLITVGDGRNTVSGGLGGDTITAGDGGNFITPGVETQEGTGRLASQRRFDTGTNTVTTGSGNDNISGSLQGNGASLVQNVNSGGGEDTVELFGGNNNTVNAGSGDDFVVGSTGNDIINGGPGDDAILGVDGDDNLSGGSGDDVIAGGRGEDAIDGGQGTDRAFDFAGEPGSQRNIEQAQTLDATDNTGSLDTSDAPLTDVSIQAVESVPSGNQLLADNNREFQDRELPPTKVIDGTLEAGLGAGGFFSSRGTGFETNEDGDLVPGPGPQQGTGSVSVTTQTFDSRAALPGGAELVAEIPNTPVVTAHELGHINQQVNGRSPTNDVASKGDINGDSFSPNLEFANIGLPFDTNGDGIADEDSQRAGVTENDFRADLGIDPRLTYTGATPLTADELAVREQELLQRSYQVNDLPGQSSTFNLNRQTDSTAVTSNNPFAYVNQGTGETGSASEGEDGNFSRSFNGPVTEINTGDGDDDLTATSSTPEGFADFTANLGDGNDEATVTGFNSSPDFGSAEINGGKGDDLITTDGGVVVNGNEGDDDLRATGEEAGEAIKRPARLNGNAGNDRLTGGDSPVNFDGGTGDDFITGGNGNNGVATGDGDDDVVLGNGNNNIRTDASLAFDDNGEPIQVPAGPGSGNDNVQVGDGFNTIRTGPGDDNVVAGDGNNFIEADEFESNGAPFNVPGSTGPGNDKVQTGNGDNNIKTGPGDDNVVLGDGNNQVVLGAGNDQTRAGNGNNVIASDINLVEQEDGSRRTVPAGEGDDFISVGDGDNVIAAGPGNNTVNTGDGANRFPE